MIKYDSTVVERYGYGIGGGIDRSPQGRLRRWHGTRNNTETNARTKT